METQAQTLLSHFRGDGSAFKDHKGKSLVDCIEILGGRLDYTASSYDAKVYVFHDKSAVVVCAGGWDIRPYACVNHCWEGVGCECDVEA